MTLFPHLDESDVVRRFSKLKISLLLLFTTLLLFVATLFVGAAAVGVATEHGSSPLFFGFCVLLVVPETIWFLRMASPKEIPVTGTSRRGAGTYGAFAGLILVVALNMIDSRYPHSQLAAYAGGIVFALTLPALVFLWLLLWRYRQIVMCHRTRR